MEKVMDKIERWKVLAELLDKEGKQVFIKNIYDDLFFGEIVLIGEDKICIDCTGPKQRAGERVYIYWINISELNECEVKE